MYTKNAMFAVVATAATIVTASDLVPSSLTTSAAVLAPTGAACPATCGCMPKLCTDDAVIKGTTTHLTYLCPETQTQIVTETVYVTHDGEPPAPSASSPGDTTVAATSKSTVHLTKTVQSKTPQSGTSVAGSSTVIISTPPDSTIVETLSSDKLSSATQAISKSTGSVPSPVHTSGGIWHNTTTSATKSNVVSWWTTLTGATISSSTGHISRSSSVGSIHPTGYSSAPTGTTGSSSSSSHTSHASSSTGSVHPTGSSLVPTGTAGSSSSSSGSIHGTWWGTKSSLAPSGTGASSSSGSNHDTGISKSSTSTSKVGSPSTYAGPPASSSATSQDSLSFAPEPTTGFISLPSDTEIFTSIAGENTVMTDATFSSSEPVTTTTVTDGIFFSSAPASPLALRDEPSVVGTVSKVLTTTTITLQGGNETIAQTLNATSSGTGGFTPTAAYPGATTVGLGPNGAANIRPNSAFAVLVLFFLSLASLFC